MRMEIELTWTWRLQAPLHCGSGIARAGYADRLVARAVRPDDVANLRPPIIPGDAVKGALRMSAEQLLAWRGVSSYYENSTEPSHGPLAALFGGAAECRFQPGRVKDGWRLARLASSAIESDSGQALKDTLRMIEVVEAGAEFTCFCKGRFDDVALTLLLAALLATESIGGNAGIGRGHLAVDNIQLSCPGSVEEYLTQGRLDRLREAVSADKSVIATEESAESTPAESTWFELRLELQESTCIGLKPDISNQISTVLGLPATTLRGALRKFWLSRENEATVNHWLGADMRWSDGFPVNEQGQLYVPLPRSYAREKDETGWGDDSPHGIHDAFCGKPAPKQDLAGTALQWRPLSEAWMSKLAAPWKLSLQTSMHVARDYCSGSKRERALFSRQTLAESHVFLVYAKLPKNILFPKEVSLGRRQSAGHGRATLTFSPLSERQAPSLLQTPDPKQDHIFVQLLTPALVRDPKTGLAMRSLTEQDWRELLGVSGIDTVEARSASRRGGGWMSTWGHPRKPETLIEAGSVWRLTCRDTTAAQVVRQRLVVMCHDSGLGERGHEGLGWFVVDPPWLGHRRGKEAGAALCPPKSSGLPGPLSWPGCETLSQAKMVEIIGALPTYLPFEARRPLQELARRARQAAQTIPALLALLDGVDITKGPWKALNCVRLGGTGLRDYLQTLNDKEAICFTLQALLIRVEEAS